MEIILTAVEEPLALAWDHRLPESWLYADADHKMLYTERRTPTG